MQMSRCAAALAATLLLSACATDRSIKPLLTANASTRIAKTCGAVRSVFHRNTPDLPYADFITPADEAVSDSAPQASVQCIHRELQAFRYTMLSFRRESTSGE